VEKAFWRVRSDNQACRNGLSVLYVRAPRLFEELTLCHADGSFRKRLAAIAKISVLIIDDFAIAPIGPRERNDLLELIDDRVGTKSSILTSQLPIEDWHDYIGDPMKAEPLSVLNGFRQSSIYALV
jgi:DNA replication protein DnaC